MEIEKSAHLVLLYDFYGMLLTNKQKDYLELYYEQDLSLSEISEELSVSRQAVYDNIKRSEQLLLYYEEQLQLLHDYQLKQSIYEQLTQHVQQYYAKDTRLQQLIDQLRNGEE